MHPRFATLPAALASRARNVGLGPDEIPALLVHPDWATPAPTLLWLHGRTATKELDPGRYLRLLRAGIATCAIDLPGHGRRPGPRLHDPKHTIDFATHAVGEIDAVLEALGDPRTDPGLDHAFDLDRLAIGGMSAGGMIALRRLCNPHPFCAALVEATSGRLSDLYFPPGDAGRNTRREPAQIGRFREKVEALDPSRHLDAWEPIPLLAIHATTDEMVPFETQLDFLDDLRVHYRALRADPNLVELLTYTDTGAPQEHAGFGRYGAEAKSAATGFLVAHLHP